MPGSHATHRRPAAPAPGAGCRRRCPRPRPPPGRSSPSRGPKASSVRDDRRRSMPLVRRTSGRTRRWLLRTPRHQADSTSSPAPGKKSAPGGWSSSRLAPLKAGRDDRRRGPASEDAKDHQRGDSKRKQCPDGAGHAVGFLLLCPHTSAGVDRDEGRRQRALAEQVLQEVRDAERRGECVRGVAQAPR